MVNQAEDDVPHDRTPLFDLRVLIAGMRFRVSSRAVKNGFIALPNCFVVCGRTKQLHGIATTAVARMALRAGKPGTRCWTDGAKHNAAKRNMIAWRRRVSMLDAQIPSKAMSTQVVPRFDARQVNLGNITFREVSRLGGSSLVGPLTLQNVPSPARGKMLSHSLQAFFVVPALSPLLKEWVDDHR